VDCYRHPARRLASYGCDFNWPVDRALKTNDPAKTILQPKNNLECGVKFLVNQTIV